jgi:hypothetical protein
MKPDDFLRPKSKDIPNELKSCRQWVCWMQEERDGKLTKVPYNPHTHEMADTTDPNTWVSFPDAAKGYHANGYHGIGYVFSKDDSFCGFDFDDCLLEYGSLNPDVQAMAAKLNSYTEYSVGAEGIHVIVKGDLPKTGRKKGKIECYDHARYFAFTGAVVSGFPTTIEPRQDEVSSIHKQIFGSQKKTSKPKKQTSKLVERVEPILEKAFKSKNGDTIKRLYDGDYGNYPSQSEADMALCCHLAFFSNNNPEVVDAAFRESGLMRDKWDSKRGDSTYGAQTIDKAIESTEERAAIQAESRSQPRGESLEPATKDKKQSQIKGVTLDELEKRYSAKVTWIWKSHIPENEPSMLAAREGDGKTTIGLQASNEMLNNHPDRMVYWLATEGAIKNTLTRARELGIKTNRFQIAQKSDGDFKFNFESKLDRKALDTLLENAPYPVVCVWVDSLRGMTSHDDNDSAVGKVMHAVNAIVCDKHRSALVYIHHFSKSKKRELLDKITGTTAAVAAVRHVLAIKRASKLKRIITTAKSNIDDMRPDLEVVKAGGRIVIYEPEAESDESQIDRAEEFLMSAFSKAEKVPAKNIYFDGEMAGLSEATLRKAQSNLGIVSKKEGKTWMWHLPKELHSALMNSWNT